MIEVKNITKTYRPKKGVPVKALDGVSLKFDDTGMVFILGKSGSGKSTLLNVLGGLDSYDSGEFVIQGKSSHDFTQADFDSYRNTLIGFIFQEYNILNDFSVGANIALAMQLQGKKATNEALNKILDEVDLTGYANRKPNELSGGQKQRVAIARALIKEPRIIMADEPTGALDSNTGKQVFDTLKKLSKTKLVIIVSHDREFAEFYGDRVIELADGKIISDISKYVAPGVEKSEGVKIIDDRILHIKQGYKLTAKDLELINGYLEKAPADTLISLDERANSSFKQIAMIDDEGNKQSFKNTSDMETVTAEEYDGENLKLIKSRMPYLNSLKMGASSLKHKKIRLIFTILLSVVAFALFGLADTFASYDKDIAEVNSLIDGKVASAVLEKSTKVDRGDYEYYSGVKASDADIVRIKQETGIDVKGAVEFMYSLDSYIDASSQRPYYYCATVAGATTFTDAEIKSFGFSVTGRMPAAQDEIAITKWHFEHFAKYGYRKTGTTIKYEASEIQSEESFLNKNITLDYNGFDYNGTELKVVGIVDTGFNKNGEYDKLKDLGDDGMQVWQFQNMMRMSLDSMMFVSDGLLSKIVSGKNDNAEGIGRRLHGENYYHSISDKNSLLPSFQSIAKLSDIQGKLKIAGKSTALGSNEALISSSQLMNLAWRIKDEVSLSQQYGTYRVIEIDEHYDSDNNRICTFNVAERQLNSFEDFLNARYNGYFRDGILLDTDFAITDEIRENIKQVYGTVDESQMKLAVCKYYSAFMTDELNKEIEAKAYEYVINALIDMDILGQSNCELYSEYQDNYAGFNTVTRDLNIVGYFIDKDSRYGDLVVGSDELYNSTMGSIENGYYKFLIGKMPTSKAEIEKLVAYTNSTGDTVFKLRNSVTDSLDSFNDMIESMAEIFIYIGIGFAVFAALMMMNFISTSISYKKREIGILRAVGARGSDVFGIFFNESAIIALINFVLAVIGTVGACIGLNSVIRNELGFPITLLSVGIRQIALIFAVSLLAAFVASLLPVIRISRKRPIDAIQNR